MGGARADFCDDRRGALKPGYDADVVLFGGDLQGLVHDVSATTIALTVCAGRITHWDRDAGS